MSDAGILSPEELELTENSLRQAESEVEKAGLALQRTRVTAPIGGRVVRRLVDRGAHVESGRALFELMDVQPLLVRVHVPAARIGRVAAGQEIEVRLDHLDEPLQAAISLVSPIVDRETGTIKVTAELHDYPSSTRAGDFVQVRVKTDRRDGALLVPSVAVFEDQGASVVYLASQGRAERREVQPGWVDRGRTEVLAGLDGSEMVVTKGQQNLRPQAPIQILEGPGAEAPESGS